MKTILVRLFSSVSNCCRRSGFAPLLPVLLLAATGIPSSAAAPATNPMPAMMTAFLGTEARRLDEQFLEGITNRAQWETRRLELRQEYFEMLGLWPLPERTPLQAQVTHQIHRPERVRVETLHFQSRPRLYVTGDLYLPETAQAGEKFPAVLYVCGHSGRGRDGNKTAFQHHGMWFATHGYVCLIIDTLQLGEITAIHHGTYRYDRWWWQARGYTPAAVECWNGIRALDYLQSRPEVDPDRLAVTGISGGGAATFWIAAADERVKVAVPVSGMSDLEDYVEGKAVNGHCDCMFLINSFRWPWTQIAALVAPRPLLFANSGHDSIFPMTGNDRIRGRLENLYRLYTNRTEQLFDIAVTPGGHDDKPELRLMAYRWINHHLKKDDGPVTEPELPLIEPRDLRAFREELPLDELNTRIDELFVPMATNALPANAETYKSWREGRMAELKRLVFPDGPKPEAREPWKADPKRVSTGVLATEAGVEIPWKYLPPREAKPDRGGCIVVLSEDESINAPPEWITRLFPDQPLILLAPRGGDAAPWSDPPPFYLHRALPLLGRTLDSCRFVDTLAATRQMLDAMAGQRGVWTIAGRGPSGVVAAYAALFEPRLSGVELLDPPQSHREGPIFLNVLRVLDIPDALGMLAPRRLIVHTGEPTAFARTAVLYKHGEGTFQTRPLP